MNFSLNCQFAKNNDAPQVTYHQHTETPYQSKYRGSWEWSLEKSTVLSPYICTANMIQRMVLTEVWHIAHFWVSNGNCAMPGSPMGQSEGVSWQ